MTSYANKLFGNSPVPASKDPVEGEVEGQISVEGTVQKTKFESIVFDEIYTRKEGHSELRTVAVGLIALPLIPVIALYDAVRYALFQYGKCDGKSWSLIDKVSEAVAALSAKVETVAEKQVLTPGDLNAQSEQAMKFHVGKILDGYRALRGGFFGKLFDSSSALRGEVQIKQGKENLTQVISNYLNRNVTQASDFSNHLASVKEYVQTLFVEGTKTDDFYVVNKVERKGPPGLLSDWANGEFEYFLKGNISVANAFLAQVNREYTNDRVAVPGAASQNLLNNLSLGVEQGLITAEQAKNKVQELAQDIYSQAIATDGPKAASVTVNNLLDAGVKAGLLNEGAAGQMVENISLTPQELATAVVKNVIQYKEQNPAAKTATLDQKIANAGRELIKQKKLDAKNEVEFLITAKDQLNAVQADLDAKAQVAIQAQKEAQEAETAAALRAVQELRDAAARQEADAVEAVRQAEAAQKVAAEKQNLFDVLKNFLNGIAEKQVELLRRYGIYDAQAAEKAQVVGQINQILDMTVLVGKDKKEMTVLQAYEYRSKKIADINSSHKTPEQQIAKLSQFDQDFGSDAVAIIAGLHVLEERLVEQTAAMNVTIKSIESLDVEIATDIATYKKFAKVEKKKLDDEPRQEIETLEKTVFKTKTNTDARYRAVHNLSPFGKLPSEDVVAADVNVDDYLEQLVPATPTMATRLWNGVTAPFGYVARAVGLAY